MAAAGTGVRFALRLSLPVFVTPPEAAALTGLDGPARPGKPSACAGQSRYSPPAGPADRLRAPGEPQPVQTIEAGAYLLAGQSQAWPLAEGATAPRTLQLEAETNLGPIQAAIDLPQG